MTINDETARRGGYSPRQLAERSVSELIGFAKGVLSDGVLSDDEIVALDRFVAAAPEVQLDPVVGVLVSRIRSALLDGRIDEGERSDIFQGLLALVGGSHAEGEAQKSSTLPLTTPPPSVIYPGKRFCLTGNFAFGTRAECEKAVTDRGGVVGGIAKSTNYVVIGEYVTPAWKNLTYGRKIMTAHEMVLDGVPIAIISEEHWVKSLG